LVSTGLGKSVGDYLLVGFKGQDRLALEHAEEKLVYVQESKNVILKDPSLLYRLIVSEDLRWLFGEGEINTDSRPRLEFVAPKLMHRDDEEIPEKLELGRHKTVSTRTKNIVRKLTASIESQIDFAAFALSVFLHFRDMVELSSATPLQVERFLRIMDRYCSNNEVEYSIFRDGEIRERCVSIQIDAIEENLDLLPDRLRSYSYLAHLFNMQGRKSEAIKYYTDALRIDPEYAEGHNSLGSVLVNQGRISEAIRHYSEALRISPGFAMAHNNLGVVLAYQGRISEAISHYSEALRIDPEYAKAHNDLGAALIRNGKIGEAVIHFREALRIRSDFEEARKNLNKALALEDG
jgi:tetratricopeptide (TPR) repeat protein